METGLQLGSLLLHIGSQIMDLTWSNKDPSYKAVSIFETVIYKIVNRSSANHNICKQKHLHNTYPSKQ